MMKRIMQRIYTTKNIPDPHSPTYQVANTGDTTICIHDGENGVESVIVDKPLQRVSINRTATSSDDSTSTWYDDEVDQAFQQLQVREQSDLDMQPGDNVEDDSDDESAEDHDEIAIPLVHAALHHHSIFAARNEDEEESSDNEDVEPNTTVDGGVEIVNVGCVADSSTDEALCQFHMLQAEGNEAIRLGNVDESLSAFEDAMDLLSNSSMLSTVVNVAEKAKLLYIVGRLCVRSRQPQKAIEYFSQELEITQSTLGLYHLNVSRVLHEIAALYDDGLGDYQKALVTYEEAFRVEYGVLQQCQLAKEKCAECCLCITLAAQEAKKQQRRSSRRGQQLRRRLPGGGRNRDGSTATGSRQQCCPKHLALQCEVAKRIRETKRCQGRLHYKLGDFDKAMQTLKPFNTATSS